MKLFQAPWVSSKLAGRWVLFCFSLAPPNTYQKPNETVRRVNLGELESQPVWLNLRLIWAPTAILGMGRAYVQHCCSGYAPVFVMKPLLRLWTGSLANDGKASTRFVGLWVRPCVLQLFLNHTLTEEQSVCSYQSSHYYPCLWTGGKCIRRLAASLCPRHLHHQIFP